MDDIFDMKLISPTRAEKLIKKASPRRWPKVEELITRPDGKPAVAPENDPRPALNMCTENEFDNVDAQEGTAEFL